MMRPDFLTIKRNRKNLRHSAKGSTWEDHKYIKRIDGTYYYPDSYEGGRHLPDGEKSSSNDKEKETSEETKREKLDLSGDDIEKLAMEVIRGNFGNGQDRKDLLGENYQEIQNRVNQIMKNTGSSSQKISDVSPKAVEIGKEIVKTVIDSVSDKDTKDTKKGIDLDRVYNVYKKK